MQYTLKCVDASTGKAVGMALWDIYLTPSDWKKGEISWLSGKDKERADALINPLWDARAKLWANEKYLYCHVIAVHPKYQRKGVGELLFKAGASIAEQTHLPIYIESSKEARRLYEKVGCWLLKERPVHKSEDLGMSNGAKEDRDVALYVWTSEDLEKLPKTIELA